MDCRSAVTVDGNSAVGIGSYNTSINNGARSYRTHRRPRHRKPTPNIKVPLARSPPAAEAEPQHNPVPEALRGVDSEQLAQGQDWKLLAQNIRRGDQHYCPFCNQWLARPTYLSRHLRTQHAVIYKFHDRVLSWLTERSSALSSPCAYCHVDFKASHTSKRTGPRASNARLQSALPRQRRRVVFFCTAATALLVQQKVCSNVPALLRRPAEHLA